MGRGDCECFWAVAADACRGAQMCPPLSFAYIGTNEFICCGEKHKLLELLQSLLV